VYVVRKNCNLTFFGTVYVGRHYYNLTFLGQCTLGGITAILHLLDSHVVGENLNLTFLGQFMLGATTTILHFWDRVRWARLMRFYSFETVYVVRATIGMLHFGLVYVVRENCNLTLLGQCMLCAKTQPYISGTVYVGCGYSHLTFFGTVYVVRENYYLKLLRHVYIVRDNCNLSFLGQCM
jgi:hypothetical protein